MPQKSFKPLGYDKNDNNACNIILTSIKRDCVLKIHKMMLKMHNLKNNTEPWFLTKSQCIRYTSGNLYITQLPADFNYELILN